MVDEFKNINKELDRADKSSNESYFSDEYFQDIENKLGEFHRGLVIVVKVDERIRNGGFDGLFHNEYMDALEEAIYFLDEIRNEPELEQCAAKVINLFEEAIEGRNLYTDEIADLDTWDEWYDDKVEQLETSCSSYLDPLDSKYYQINDSFFNRLESLIERRFAKENLT